MRCGGTISSKVMRFWWSRASGPCMTKRQTPPGRKSNLEVVVVKPNGPHHCARCFGLVQAEKTSARGASNSRVPMIDRGSRSRSTRLVAAIFSVLRAWLVMATLLNTLLVRIFRLQLLQIGIQPIETLVEKTPVMIEPVVDVLEHARLDPARPPLRLAASRDQAGALQHFEVFGNRRQAHGERLGEFGHRGLTQGQSRKNRPAGRVGKRGEGSIERQFSYPVK